MATLNFALKQCNKFAVMEMSFLLFIGFARRAKQGHAAKGGFFQKQSLKKAQGVTKKWIPSLTDLPRFRPFSP